MGVRATASREDEGGAVLISQRPLEPIVYDIDLAAAPGARSGHPSRSAPGARGSRHRRRHTADARAGPRCDGIGQRWASGQRRSSDSDSGNYTETSLTLVGCGGDHPLEDFLFRYKSGHCEYFASAMVLLLRSQGIPARLVTGFLGGEYNRLEGYYVVRQVNAHAWVEAWIEGEGWRTFDATPPDGRPGSGGEGALQRSDSCRTTWFFAGTADPRRRTDWKTSSACCACYGRRGRRCGATCSAAVARRPCPRCRLPPRRPPRPWSPALADYRPGSGSYSPSSPWSWPACCGSVGRR